MDQTNHCGSFQPNPFCDSVTVNIYFAWRITFPLLSLLLGFWFKFLPWRQGSVHLHCQLERRNLRVVNIPVGHSQKFTKVLGGSVPKEKVKALWLLSWLCFISILTGKSTKDRLNWEWTVLVFSFIAYVQHFFLPTTGSFCILIQLL